MAKAPNLARQLSPLQSAILDLLAGLPPASIVTYGELAEQLSSASENVLKKDVRNAVRFLQNRTVNILPTRDPDGRHDLAPDECWMPEKHPHRVKLAKAAKKPDAKAGAPA